ncbi:chorismate-binding protein [uncultured Polaribacter sp.]|uniref:chorismate-binding protein n=1 Tax=uncultured Polaribacter sp. TaxID=174711 RepID=UPI0026036FDD|nr:chorismate-binding protein [uncultured Polaribacter sp.]
MNIIFNRIEENFQRLMPFVAYRKPNSSEISGLFLEDDTLYFTNDFTESGFIFSPFDSEEKSVLLPIEKSEFIREKFQIEEKFLVKNDVEVDELHKEKHIRLVEKALDEINKNHLKKVVVSRQEEVLLDSFDLLTTFKKLLNNYVNAFVYVWFHPKIGLWFGATPETLLTISDYHFTTMSLAGTQVYADTKEVFWKSKELVEQQLVTDFIKNQLKPISSNLKIDKTETVKAGNILHLRSRIEGDLNKNSNLKELIRKLHPTPAVCGLPREKSKNFIIQNENYKRTYYTGFLGELNYQNKNSSLFVNLRCMNIEEKIAFIYVGGGITKESNAKKEWKETIAKSKTMKKIL